MRCSHFCRSSLHLRRYGLDRPIFGQPDFRTDAIRHPTSGRAANRGRSDLAQPSGLRPNHSASIKSNNAVVSFDALDAHWPAPARSKVRLMALRTKRQRSKRIGSWASGATKSWTAQSAGCSRGKTRSATAVPSRPARRAARQAAAGPGGRGCGCGRKVPKKRQGQWPCLPVIRPAEDIEGAIISSAWRCRPGRAGQCRTAAWWRVREPHLSSASRSR